MYMYVHRMSMREFIRLTLTLTRQTERAESSLQLLIYIYIFCLIYLCICICIYVYVYRVAFYLFVVFAVLRTVPVASYATFPLTKLVLIMISTG